MAWLAIKYVIFLALLCVSSFFSGIKDDDLFPFDVLLIDVAAILCDMGGLLLLERFLAEEVFF